MKDPVLELTRQRMRDVERAAENTEALENEFRGGKAWRPVLTIMKHLRDQAAAALNGLATANPEDPKQIRHLQNQVQLFSDFVAVARQVYDAGIEAASLLDEADRQELGDLIAPLDERAEHEFAKDLSDDD